MAYISPYHTCYVRVLTLTYSPQFNLKDLLCLEIGPLGPWLI